MMELEALQEINAEITALGARIVAITPELERYTRNVHRRLNLTFDILTDLHLKTSQQFGLVFVLPDYLRDLYKSYVTPWIGSTANQNTDCRCPPCT